MFQNHSNCLELFGISQKRGFAQSYGLDTMCRHPTENSQIRYRVSFMFSCLLYCFQQQLPNKLYIIKFDLNVMNHHCFILLYVEVFEWIYYHIKNICKFTSSETRCRIITYDVRMEFRSGVSFVSFSCRHKKMKVII